MVNLLKTSSRVAGALLAAALLLPAQTAQHPIARPGTVNYIEGQVLLNGAAVRQNAEVVPGQVLETQDGKVEMLLTPGVFLRLNDHSSVKMVATSLTDTRVDLLSGTAMVEAEQVEKENHLGVIDHGSTTLIQKHGIYAFRADQPTVAVYEGKAQVQQDDVTREVHKGEEVAVTPDNPKLKTESFNVKKTENSDPLYAWSKLRSEYVAQANMSLAQTVVVNNPGWWYGTGWYWNPYFDSWAFMPGDGYLFSPFGWGFYSPGFWGTYYAPYYGYGRYPIRPGRVPAFTRGSAPAVGPRMGVAPRMGTAPMGRPSFGGGAPRMGTMGSMGGMRGGRR